MLKPVRATTFERYQFIRLKPENGWYLILCKITSIQ